MLIAIKLLHTVVWALLAGSILALPILGLLGRFRWAARIVSLVLLECLVLALNHMRCPMTDWAAPYTTDRSPNFDIYLPMWLALHNKQLFGALFLVGGLITAVAYVQHRRRAAARDGAGPDKFTFAQGQRLHGGERAQPPRVSPSRRRK